MKTYTDSAGEGFTSTMYLFLAGDEPPSKEAVENTLKEWGWEMGPHEVLARMEGVEWAEALGNDEVIFLVSLEKADELTLKLIHLDEARVEEERTRENARNAKWLLRVETQWDAHYPMDSFRQQVQFCAAISVSRKVPVYDFNSTHLYSCEEVYDLAFGKVPPKTTSLFVVHDLYPPEGPDHDGHWMHTHGLNRAGLPEFELLNVPARHVEPAGELLVAVADLLLGGGQPPLRKTVQVGGSLKVSLIEWEKFVFQLPLETVGGMHSRTRESGEWYVFRPGYRVAVVSQKPKGFFKKKWSLPVTVLAAIAKAEEGTIWKSIAEIERSKILANDRWHIFRKLYERKRDDWKFLLKLGCPIDASASRHEYLWFNVLELEQDRVRATLRTQPFGAKKFKPGEEAWHPLDKIADWKVLTPDRDVQPEDATQFFKGLEGKEKSSATLKPVQAELSLEKKPEAKGEHESQPTPPASNEPPKQEAPPQGF